MAGLLEKTVQKRAMIFLEKYYDTRFLRRKIFSAEEVRTKKVFGGKRADGLLVFQKRLWGKPYVVSMEAKSIKTLPAIKPYQDYGRWLWNSARIGCWLCLASGLLFAYGQEETYGLSVWVPLTFSLLAGLSFGLLTWNNYRHKTVDVISQLKQYPANEQWLAFSDDAFLALVEEKQKMLKTICKYRGIGLLLVQKNKGIQVLTTPKRQWTWFWETRGGWQWISDYLVYYSKEKEIRAFI